jgi:hypothetical protein
MVIRRTKQNGASFAMFCDEIQCVAQSVLSLRPCFHSAVAAMRLPCFSMEKSLAQCVLSSASGLHDDYADSRIGLPDDGKPAAILSNAHVYSMLPYFRLSFCRIPSNGNRRAER